MTIARTLPVARMVLALLAVSCCAPALAQAQSCAIPPDFRMPRADRANPPARSTPITRYTLALSWTPGYCHRRDADQRSMQCSGEHGRFGFILHGLWPESDGGAYPQYCAPASAVPRDVLRQYLCTTPSPDLLQHEWERHGTCMSRDPERYFATGARLFNALRFPAMQRMAADRALTVRQFRAAFAQANQGMRPDMLSVQVNGGGWLEEVHVCMTRALQWRTCPTSQRGARDSQRLRIDWPNP